MEIAFLGNVPQPFLTEYKCSYYFAHKQKYKIVFCSFPLFSGQIFLAVPKVRPGQKTHSRPQTSRGNIPFHTNFPIFVDLFMICTYFHIPNCNTKLPLYISAINYKTLTIVILTFLHFHRVFLIKFLIEFLIEFAKP